MDMHIKSKCQKKITKMKLHFVFCLPEGISYIHVCSVFEFLVVRRIFLVFIDGSTARLYSTLI